MFLPVELSSGLPIYRQLMEQVRRMLAAGSLRPGDKLPSVRELSANLRINPLTAAKAYQELEHAGLVEMRRGLGVFVAAGARASPVNGAAGRTAAADLEPARGQAVAASAERLVLEAVQAGLGRDEILALVKQVWNQVRKGTRGESE